MHASLRSLSWVVPALLLGCAADSDSAETGAAAEPPSIGAAAEDAGVAQAATSDASAEHTDTAATPTPESPPRDRAVLLGHVENARDLGGITLGAGREVSAGALFRGPPLAALTADGCAAVSELGVRTIVDLRIASEVSVKPDAECALKDAQLLAAPLPVPYNVSAADYIAVLDAGDSILRVFETLGDASRYPVYFHCTWGRDRTGIVAAVILLALGATPDVIMEDYLVSGETVGAYPASLQAALDEIAARGGSEAYLAAVGVSAQQLETLRARAITSTR